MKFKLIETMFFVRSHNYKRMSHLQLHLKRLKDSAKYFDFNFNENVLLLKLKNLQSFLKNGKYKIRVLLDKEGGIEIEHKKLNNIKNCYKLKVIKQSTSSADIFLYHKTTQRKLYEKELKKARVSKFFDVIFRNEKAEITEGAITNIYIKKAGIFYTPPVGCGLLNGIIRRMVLRKKNIIEKILFENDIINADEVYISNSIIGFKKAIIK